MASSTVEDYLKTLYQLHQAEDVTKIFPIGRLATAMGVVPGTATSMVKALADAGLVEYEVRAGVRLSPKGEQLALHVLRRHRLVERFLVDVLGLDWSEVHEEADLLEHAISDRVLERIDLYLGHPTVDPHGDPIPTARGTVEDSGRMSLADCMLSIRYRVTRILNQHAEFLQFIERQGLKPGASVAVVQRESAADAATIQVLGQDVVSLSLMAASQILVTDDRPDRCGHES